MVAERLSDAPSGDKVTAGTCFDLGPISSPANMATTRLQKSGRSKVLDTSEQVSNPAEFDLSPIKPVPDSPVHAEDEE